MATRSQRSTSSQKTAEVVAGTAVAGLLGAERLEQEAAAEAKHVLVVVQAFGEYVVGQVIEAAAEVRKVLEHNSHMVVRRGQPAQSTDTPQ